MGRLELAAISRVCGRQSCLQAGFPARRWSALAIHRTWLRSKLGQATCRALLPVGMAHRATKGDENSHRPIINRPPDAIRPHLRSGQYEAFDRAAAFQAALRT